jgi:hypothetical protein
VHARSMRLEGIAAVVAVALAVAGCGLGLDGLGETSDDDAGGADAAIGGDATMGGGDGASSSSGGDADAAEAAVSDAPTDVPADDSPAPPPEAGCTGVMCNGFCTGVATCQGCGGANLLCPGTNTCTTDCTACPGSPIQCFACDATRSHPIGTCQPDSPTAYCIDTNYAGAYAGGMGYHCACTFATDCPGNDQVCIGVGTPMPPFACFTCGETFTEGTTCKSGNGSAKCDQMKATCQ